MFTDVEWVVPVTRHYHWLIKPMIMLCKKYLDIPITFWSDRPIPDLDRKHKAMEIFRLDSAIYRESVGDLIKNALNQIEKPIVAIILIDMLPQNMVDLNRLELLKCFMLEYPIARGNLHFARNYEDQFKKYINTYTSDVLVRINNFYISKISCYHELLSQIGSTSLLPALWNRKFLLEFIEDHWSFDKLELPGQYKFMGHKHDHNCPYGSYVEWDRKNWFSVCTYPALYDNAHLCFTRAQDLVEIKNLKKEDKEYVMPYVPEELRIC